MGQCFRVQLLLDDSLAITKKGQLVPQVVVFLWCSFSVGRRHASSVRHSPYDQVDVYSEVFEKQRRLSRLLQQEMVLIFEVGR